MLRKSVRRGQHARLSIESLEERRLLAVLPTLIGRYETGLYDVGAAEISAHDPATQRLFVVNGGQTRIDVLDIQDPSQPTRVASIDVTPYGTNVNSVAFHDGVLAAAIENKNPSTGAHLPGQAAFFDAWGNLLGRVTVGALPDMITFSPDGMKALTANEGEPNSYGQANSFDPEGSVSVIDLAAGVANATVTTIGFADFNVGGPRHGELSSQIRIYGPGATVAQDLEPEYITVSDDSTKAYVTLQENNALAEIDLATLSIVGLRPLGFKDHSANSSTLETFTFTDLPVLGATAECQEVPLGGFSGLHFEGVDPVSGNLRFITHTDRGPNGANVGALRPFALPEFQPEWVRFEVDRSTGQVTITDRIGLTRPDGTPLTGLPNLAGTAGLAYADEIPTDLFNVPLTNPNGDGRDPLGADLEGIVKAGDGTYWMVDEYRPAIYHFDATGRMIDRFVPIGSGAATGTETLPAVYARRRANRGFEAVALEGTTLYAFIQSPLDNPDVANDANSRAGSVTRILAIDTTTGQPTGEYLYKLDGRGNLPGSSDKIGDAVSLGGGKFLVMERDDDVGAAADKRIYSIDLAGATNILGLPDTFASTGGKTIEQITDAERAAVTEIVGGIQVAPKTLVIDLHAAGFDFVDKMEGLTLIDANTIAVINDNDFQMGAVDSTTGMITFTTTPEVLGIITINGNGLDASDRDGPSNSTAVNIAKWPVFGMYQPDSIASYVVDGETYLVMANEGDARDYTGFSEERRVSTLTLDPTAFPNGATLKSNANLGRLNVTNQLGDTGGDGDFDKLYALGARSFSIRKSDGTLVYDSGDDIEQITAALFPANFNASNTNNNRDDRSDNKGPEPEGLALGKLGDRTYAFIGLERIGGVMVYDVTNPLHPEFQHYVNPRNFGVSTTLPDGSSNPAAGDLGPEGVLFIPAADSPNGASLLVLANEISGTVSIFQLNAPPVAVAQPDAQLIRPGEVAAFDGGQSSDPDGDALQYAWDFGDGAIGTGAAVQHVYSSPGIYDVTLTVDDGFGGTHATTTTVYVTGVAQRQGELQIVGTNAPDVVVIQPAFAGGNLSVVYPPGTTFQSTGLVSRIVVELFDGADNLRVSPNVLTPVLARGGAGNDILLGGSGPNVLLGGSGVDLLTGGPARDVLIGGVGGDTLNANGGDDLLIAGSTVFDDDDVALLAMQAAWLAPTATYAQRVDLLRSTVLKKGETVADDVERDLVYGAFGDDWYLLELGKDSILGRASNERVN